MDIEVHDFEERHRMGDHATHPLARPDRAPGFVVAPKLAERGIVALAFDFRSSLTAVAPSSVTLAQR